MVLTLYIEERNTSKSKDKIKFITDLYSEKYTDYHGDFVCCKMTLEHIHSTFDFVKTVRKSIGDRFDTMVFFQIPNGKWVFEGLGFWDIYYEHCSYFSTGSLNKLFSMCGFDVLEVSTEYDDQYLATKQCLLKINGKSIDALNICRNGKMVEEFTPALKKDLIIGMRN